MKWQFYRKWKGKTIQEYTIGFKKKATLLGIYFKYQQVLIKYIEDLLSHLRITIMLFNPMNLDQVSV